MKTEHLEAPSGWYFQTDLCKVFDAKDENLLINKNSSRNLSNFLKQFCQSTMYLYNEPNSSNVISPLLSLSNIPWRKKDIYTVCSIQNGLRKGAVTVVGLLWHFWGSKGLLCDPKTWRKLLIGQKCTLMILTMSQPAKRKNQALVI